MNAKEWRGDKWFFYYWLFSWDIEISRGKGVTKIFAKRPNTALVKKRVPSSSDGTVKHQPRKRANLLIYLFCMSQLLTSMPTLSQSSRNREAQNYNGKF